MAASAAYGSGYACQTRSLCSSVPSQIAPNRLPASPSIISHPDGKCQGVGMVFEKSGGRASRRAESMEGAPPGEPLTPFARCHFGSAEPRPPVHRVNFRTASGVMRFVRNISNVRIDPLLEVPPTSRGNPLAVRFLSSSVLIHSKAEHQAGNAANIRAGLGEIVERHRLRMPIHPHHILHLLGYRTNRLWVG